VANRHISEVILGFGAPVIFDRAKVVWIAAT
jgi:hypothetical protein